MKQRDGIVTRALDGQYLGFTENGRKLLIAVLSAGGGRLESIEFLQFFSANAIVAHWVEQEPLGFGTVETLALSTSNQGWRPADYWIDRAPFHHRSDYDEFPFYWGPFQTHGGKSLAAIALLTALRRLWPQLPATETSPGECYLHLMRSTAWPNLSERLSMLSRWLGIELPADLDECGWEAAMSAYAMWMGATGQWPINLHRLTTRGGEWAEISADGVETYWEPAVSFESLIFPAGPVAFFWPPDERFVDPREDGSMMLESK